ncbi:selenocysteine-specific translation elongation factor [Ancylobacter novellus DSM 506]|uniref:Selenocysteine-specific elongation factor n=1 Tax=Ancylobacter novellus (strain ATCC 8093 / DSM 506 / JCM 20403 / CCM 1077 / IAM 12100 / NBRC 12443 / NCIMB 10456) TaxID=639283 RepID=D7A9Z6_ANCN5|nr:selenocysteine-specific translation elongation factor [Ancylobacter novellus]ADH90783.1 selenocysteine-specific translation elongation factor [Ancylobacter novellus DSM 506]
MIIGTAGHIDHGKTALVGALTGVDTDRLKEEKARGISIDLGFAYLPTEAGTLGFIDVPGHEKFIHTMLAGASGIDFALLIVAADDGVMPQTREHLALLDLLGISSGLVTLTKADLADAARRGEVEAEIAALLDGTSLEGVEVLAVSAVTGEGIEELRARLVAAGRDFSARAAEGRFRLAVDRSFTLSGAGTVVTGTVLSGRVRVGDQLVVSPSGIAARVRSIHAQNRKAEEGRAGDRCALNLAGEGVSHEAIHRGDMVLDASLHAPTERIDTSLRVLAGEPKPLGQWFPVRFHHGSTEVGARLVPLSEDAIPPGGEGLVQIVLEKPIAAAAGDRYVIRDTSAQRTIGGGRLIDLRAPGRKRRTPERLAQLAAMGEADPDAAVALLLAGEPFHLDLSAFARDRALGGEAVQDIAQRLGLVTFAAGGTLTALSPERWKIFRATLLAELERFHDANPDLPGMGAERLRLTVPPRLAKPVFTEALRRLAGEGALGLDGAWVRLAGHEVRLTRADELLWELIEPKLSGTERFRPPRVRDLAGLTGEAEADIRRLMKLLSRMGRVDEVAHDHFFLRPVVTGMVAMARELAAAAPGGQFPAAAFRDRIERDEHAVGRKVAIQILEFFDRHGVTLRRGDLRRINPHRLDLFGAIGENDPASATSPAAGRASHPVMGPDFKSGRTISMIGDT